MTNKEKVYDDLINPLIGQIIDICKEHHIAMLATFAIPTPDNEGLACTTSLPDESGKQPDWIANALREVRGRGGFAMLTVTRPIESKEGA